MLVGDTESDSFKFQSTVIWVICEYDLDDNTYGFSFDSSITQYDLRELVKQKMGNQQFRFYDSHESHLKFIQANTFMAHNYFQHDKPLIKKFFPWFNPVGEEDSFILSQLYNPDRQIPPTCKGAHGLEAWGVRFGVPKPKHEEWHRFSPEMLHRVIEDVKINVQTKHALDKEADGWDWSLSKKIEYGVADIQGRQEMHGVYLDQEKAYALADELYLDIQEIDEELITNMPSKIIQGVEVSDPYKKPEEKGAFLRNGDLRPEVAEWFGEVDESIFKGKLCLTKRELKSNCSSVENVWGSFCKVDFQAPNINSHTQMKEFLLTQGWVPTEFTEKGSPQLTEDSYASIKGELGQLIAKRNVLKHRAQMIFNINKQGQMKGWLNMVRSDGRLEAGAITNATNTGRMAHRIIVNTPKPKDKLWKSGIQLRELITVGPNNMMMGIDADGLEARCEAAACLPFEGGEEYAKELIEGDIHSSTAYKNGAMTDEEYAFFYAHKVDEKPLEEKDRAEYKRLSEIRDFWKAPKYSLTYGAQPPTLMKTIGIKAPLGCTGKCWSCPTRRKSSCEGFKIHQGFWANNTALSALKEAIVGAWKARKDAGKGSFIIGVDGRKIWIRSEHSVVNAYFQNMGSVAVKVAALFLDKWCRQRNMKAQQVIIMHDELEYEHPPEERSILEEIAPQAFVKAGKFLKIPVPITGTPDFGLNWKDVH